MMAQVKSSLGHSAIFFLIQSLVFMKNGEYKFFKKRKKVLEYLGIFCINVYALITIRSFKIGCSLLYFLQKLKHLQYFSAIQTQVLLIQLVFLKSSWRKVMKTLPIMIELYHVIISKSKCFFIIILIFFILQCFNLQT